MRHPIAATLLVVVVAFVGGCAEPTQDTGIRSNAHGDMVRQGSMQSGDRGGAPRDMPGRGRGSEPTKGSMVNH